MQQPTKAHKSLSKSYNNQMVCSASASQHMLPAVDRTLHPRNVMKEETGIINIKFGNNYIFKS